MSRTYRNTRYRQMWGGSMQWVLRDSTYNFDEIPFDDVDNVQLNPWSHRTSWEFHYKTDSKEGKKRIARYLSDNGTHDPYRLMISMSCGRLRPSRISRMRRSVRRWQWIMVRAETCSITLA